ncbi:Filamin-A [Holothuria leucospilota]|uniref:Filamin-A n=1 Tax=Holothuria leucospilota TaxID=206669 RepID=A0A9Q1C186_HOLLE|nr:Filamin-A [Holothuria leucospilota]
MSNCRRRRQEVQSSSQEVRDAVQMSVSWIYKQGAGLFYQLFYLICLLRYLNFVPILFKIFKAVSRRSTDDSQLKYGLADSIVYRANFTERLVNLFKSEASKRDFLLSWVRRKLPDQNVRNFNQSWCSGIALCALAEATKPGTCPRYDLLLPGEDVNNCRLGMKLIRRSFGILEPMDPEEMAIPDLIDEDVIVSYIAMIRYASMVPNRSSNTSQTVTYSSGKENENGLPAIQECEASGSGLVTAIVGRRAKFNVTKPTYIKKKLTIKIEGPNGENTHRLIEDLSTDDQVQQYSEDIEGILSNAGEYSTKATGAIDFDYQKIKVGYYQISYTPPSAGLYQLSVFWGGEHITNSPFSIKVLKTKSVHPQVKKSVSFSSNAEGSTEGSMNIEPLPSEPPVRARRQSLFRQAHVSSTNKDSHPSTCSSSAISMSSSQDLYRTTSLLASSCDDRLSPSISLNRSSSILSSSGDRQGTLRTRRRVIKRVVKGPDGKDEVYYPSSSEQSFQRSSDLGSLSLSLSVSCDDRLSPYPSRSPSPSPVFLAPAPTLASVERQISRFAQRSAQLILSGAFYELSKDVIFASSNLNKQEKPSGGEVLKVVRKEMKNHPSLTETQDTTSSSFLDGISIKTDSMVDDVFDTSLSTESSDRYEVVRPIFDSSNSSNDRYHPTYSRPRYESETYFRPITHDQADIPQTSRNPKWRSRSESDNPKSSDGEKLSSDNIPSGFTCFRPVSRKVGNSSRQAAGRGTGHVVHTTAIEGHVRHPKLKSRRLKEQSHQETQCSADEIKRITGWVSRRERFKSVHNMKEVKSRDLIISKDQLSTAFQTSVKEEMTTEEGQSGNEPQKDSKGEPSHVELSRTRAVSEPIEHGVRRPQMQPRSKSFGKQSTFDSGYSDENGHNGTHSTLFSENTAHCENGPTTTRSSPDGDTHAPSKEKNSSEMKFPKTENGHVEEVPSGQETGTVTKGSVNGSDTLISDKLEQDKISQGKKHNQLEIFPTKENNSNTEGQKPSNDTKESVTIMKFFNQNSTVDSAQPFSTYWDELIYHLENDPKFPVHEFISRVKNISMDVDPNDSLTSKVNQGITSENFDTNGNRVVVNKDVNENSSRNPPRTDSENAVRPNCCRAQGCGLQRGTVGSKNNFQVCTQDAGDGSLSVSIRGPRRHAVTECSVIYTGDDFYEVLYDVSLAGFYVISVKWADLHISDSPFIVKVSF